MCGSVWLRWQICVFVVGQDAYMKYEHKKRGKVTPHILRMDLYQSKLRGSSIQKSYKCKPATVYSLLRVQSLIPESTVCAWVCVTVCVCVFGRRVCSSTDNTNRGKAVRLTLHSTLQLQLRETKSPLFKRSTAQKCWRNIKFHTSSKSSINLSVKKENTPTWYYSYPAADRRREATFSWNLLFF